MENQNADVQIVLEEMRRQFDVGLRTGELLDQKAGAFLVAAGALIVLALGGQPASSLPWVQVLTLLVAALYAVAFALALVSIRTRNYKARTAGDWEALDQYLFGKAERDAILVQVSTYIEVIEHNRQENNRKARLVDWGLWLSAGTAVLTIALVVLT